MPELTPDAAQVMAAVRSLQLLDDSSLHILMQLFCNRTDEELVEALVSVHPDEVANTLLQVAQNASSPHTLAYSLCFFADLVYLSKTLAMEVGRLSGAAEAFIRFTTTHEGDISITNPSIFLAAVSIRYSSQSRDALEPCLLSFMEVVRRAFSEEVLLVSNVEFVVRACVQVARRKCLRAYFFKENIISYVPRLLTEMVSANTSSIMQLIYDTLLLTWLLSYEFEGIIQLQRNRLIPQLLRVLQRMQKEKCLRLALLTLWNMVELERRYLQCVQHPTGEWVDEKLYLLAQLRVGDAGAHKGPILLAEMVGVGMQKTLSALKRRKFGDDDIAALLEELSKRLEESLETITSFSEYRGEVFSGTLDWTPVHTSSKFWREHTLLMESNNYEVLNALGKLVLETRDDRTLAVACHDLGETVRYHPTGRSLLLLPTMKGVKERVIQLMSDNRAEVAKEALLCTQKIMVQQWEYISSPTIS